MGELAHILVVDDDLASRGLMAQILAEDGHAVTPCADGAEAIKLLEEERSRSGDGYDAVVSDIRMMQADGLEVLDWAQKNAPETPVLLVTAFGNVDGAVDAIRRGAYDYISKPYDVNAIKLVVDRALRHRRLGAENRRLKREISEKYSLQNVVGRSEVMLQVYKTAARVASTDATVLVVGESGTGKELVARAIHGASRRAQGPFIAVDCDERTLRPARGPVDGARHQLLPGAGFPYHQHGRVRRRDSRRRLVDLQHDLAAPDHVLQRVLLADLALEPPVLGAEPPVPEGAVHHQLDGVHVVRLGDVVVRPAPDGVDRAVHVAEGGDQQHGRLDDVLHHPVEHLEPVRLDHADVADHRVEALAAALLLLAQELQRLRPIGRDRHLVAVLGEDLRHQPARGQVVVHHQDASQLSHAPPA